MIAPRPSAKLAPFAEQQDQVGDVAIGDEDLAAIDDHRVVALGRKAGLHAGGVGAGLGLGDRQRQQRSLGDARQQAPLLFLAAEIDQWLRRVEIGRPDDPGRGAGGGNLAHAGEIGGVAHPGAAVRLGHEHRVEAERVNRLDIGLRKFSGAVVSGGVRRDLVAGKRPDAVQQLLFLRRQWRQRIETVEEGGHDFGQLKRNVVPFLFGRGGPSPL